MTERSQAMLKDRYEGWNGRARGPYHPRRTRSVTSPSTEVDAMRRVLRRRAARARSRARREQLFAETALRHAVRSNMRGVLVDHAARETKPKDGEDTPKLPQFSVMRVIGLPGVILIFGSIIVLNWSHAFGLAGMYFGFAIYSVANYTAYRVNEFGVTIGPTMAPLLAFGSFGLGIVALLSAF